MAGLGAGGSRHDTELSFVDRMSETMSRSPRRNWQRPPLRVECTVIT